MSNDCLERMSCQVLTIPLAVLVIFLPFGSTSEPCYHFKFPKEFQNVIRATEGSTVTLPAKLDTDACKGRWNKPIHVYVKYPPNEQDLSKLFCIVIFDLRNCTPSHTESCSCLEDNFGDTGVNFTKTVTKADSGSWLWSTGDGLKIEINFDIKETPPIPPIAEPKKENPGDNSMKTGLITGSVNIVIAVTIVLVLFLCRRRRAREVKAKCTVNFTPVLEGDDDVLAWAQRRDDPNDVGRSTSYVSFGGTMTWSNENIPQVHRNEGYLATSPSDQSFCPMVHP